MNALKYFLVALLTFTFIGCGGDDDNDNDGGSNPDENVTTFNTKMSGKQSVPRVASEQSAEATIEIHEAISEENSDSENETSGELTLDAEVDLSDVENVEAAHIHAAEVGMNGDVAFTFEDSDEDGVWTIEGESVTQAQMDALEAGLWYVNVHTTDYPDGEIRGQVTTETQTLFTFDLNGEQNVPSNETVASADGYALYDSVDGAMTVNVVTEGVNATAAQLFMGEAGVNGEAIFSLSQNEDNASVWGSADDAVLSVSEETSLSDAMLYVSVSSLLNADGHVRGQILPENYEVMVFPIESSQEVPRVDSSANGTGYATLNTDSGWLRLNAWASDDAEITAAHIHEADVAANGEVVVTLEQDSENAGLWSTPVNTSLSTDMQETFVNGGHYVNMHSEAHADGELRGQVVSGPWEVLTFDASGEQVVPAVETEANADGYALVNTQSGELSLTVITQGITTVDGGELKRAAIGSNGEAVLSLNVDGDDANILRTPGDTSLSQEELAVFLASGHYVSVESAEYPEGEIRGQILNASAIQFPVTLDGESVVPSVSTEASATGAFTVNKQTGILQGAITTSNIVGTSAEIRQAAIGEADGDLILELNKSGDNAFVVPDNTELSSEQIATMLLGAYYVVVNSDAYTSGEIRSQIIVVGDNNAE